MSNLFLCVFLLSAASSTSSAAVEVTGSTQSTASYPRPSETELAPRCPLSHPFALDNGLKCCSSPKRFLSSSSCSAAVGGGGGDALRREDPEDCCQSADTVDCPGMGPSAKCVSLRVNSVCPRDRPFPSSNGARCCAFNKRKSSCIVGDGEYLLEPSDPSTCCLFPADAVDCPPALASSSSSSSSSLCAAHPRTNPCYERSANKMNFTQAISYCEGGDRLPIMFRTKSEIRAIGKKASYDKDFWTRLYMPGSPGDLEMCENSKCDGFIAWDYSGDAADERLVHSRAGDVCVSANDRGDACFVWDAESHSGAGCLHDRGCEENQYAVCQVPC